MARIPGVEARQAGWLTRILYWFARRKMVEITGRDTLTEPLTVTAHHPRLLVALGQMEMGQAAARSVPVRLKALAGIKAALEIGCPF